MAGHEIRREPPEEFLARILEFLWSPKTVGERGAAQNQDPSSR
jgi:hypothetical protein